MKRKKTGFTSIELLTVLAIIALLVGLLLPALTVVRNTAREAKQKAQFTTIDLGLTAFKNDFGDYPPSDAFSHNTGQNDYCGAQKLTEALLGQDLLGFHPGSSWSAIDPCYPPNPPVANLNQRKGPYLEVTTANAFRLGEPEGLFANPTPLNPDRFVICDVFGRKSMFVGGKPVKVGTPVLYYRANTLSKTIEPLPRGAPPEGRIYNVLDNYELIHLGRPIDRKQHPLDGPPDTLPSPWDSERPYKNFYRYIRDTKFLSVGKQWPYRAESYILISAGVDGFYGTPDDICNFGR